MSCGTQKPAFGNFEINFYLRSNCILCYWVLFIIVLLRLPRRLYHYIANGEDSVQTAQADLELRWSQSLEGCFRMTCLKWHICLSITYPCVHILNDMYLTGLGSLFPLCKRSLTHLLLLRRSFTPFSTLFQLYHGDSSLIHDPWVNKPVLG